MKNYKIIGNKNLTFRQKLEYLSSISYWFFGVRRMVYLLAPLLFSILGIIIVDCNLYHFIALWLPAYIMKRFALDSLEQHRRSSTWNKIYETILTPILCKEALKEFFGAGDTTFEVTPKYAPTSKMSATNKKLLWNHLILLVLNIVGFIMCLVRIRTAGISVYMLSLLWIVSNIFYLSASFVFDLKYKTANYTNFIPNKVMAFKKITSGLIFFNSRKRYVQDRKGNV